MIKKLLVFLTLIFLLSGCGNNTQKLANNIDFQIEDSNLAPISEEINGILVGTSDPHVYSKKGPKVLSGTYYFNPRNFYTFDGDLGKFKNSYKFEFDNQKIYYYDDVEGINAGIVVYILRNIYNKKNVSLALNSELKSKLKHSFQVKQITGTLEEKNYGSGFVGTGKYRIVYNPSKIQFKTGDLLLYSSAPIDMKDDKFYQENKGKLNIKQYYVSYLLDNSKLKKGIKKELDKLNLEKYDTIYIYYPKRWYISGLFAVVLENIYK